jgi:hypothetical protein
VYHPEPWHGKEHHDDVLKRKAALANVAAVSAKAQNLCSATPPTRRGPKGTRDKNKHPTPAWALRPEEIAPEPPPLHPLRHTRPKDTTTTAVMVFAGEPPMQLATGAAAPASANSTP